MNCRNAARRFVRFGSRGACANDLECRFQRVELTARGKMGQSLSDSSESCDAENDNRFGTSVLYHGHLHPITLQHNFIVDALSEDG